MLWTRSVVSAEVLNRVYTLARIACLSCGQGSAGRAKTRIHAK